MSKRYAKRGVTEQKLRDMIDKDGLYEAVWSEKVQKDISKIQFDCENIGIEEDEFNMEGFEPGYETLANGVPVLWVGAGGDWEPVVTEGEWQLEACRKSYPKKTWDLLPKLLDAMNENVRHGCCGGRI